MKCLSLPLDFYDRPAPEVAEDLIGRMLVCETEEGRATGIILETEAYLAQGDPANHASVGRTTRNAPMFGPPGHAYVYFVYGMHWCFNAVTGPEGVPEAVLIRALEPREGVELMYRRRGCKRRRDLCSGPAKLAQAMGITGRFSGLPLNEETGLYVMSGARQVLSVRTAPRVGVIAARDLPLRFIAE